jgi:hypothetical protein
MGLVIKSQHTYLPSKSSLGVYIQVLPILQDPNLKIDPSKRPLKTVIVLHISFVICSFYTRKIPELLRSQALCWTRFCSSGAIPEQLTLGHWNRRLDLLSDADRQRLNWPSPTLNAPE